MFCSKIGSDCPHDVTPDENYIFVLMPFEGFDNVYDTIKRAVEEIEGKNYKCERADTRFTTFQIWCNRICKSIRKAKYIIADTTGRNPNVFYELGFTHAMFDTEAIIITQNIEEAPFDIKDLGHVIYDEKKLRELEKELQKAIIDIEKEKFEETKTRKSPDELIIDLKSKVREEEERADKFKKQLKESEESEEKNKKALKELEAIKENPTKEAKRKIAELEGNIAELKSKLKYTEQDKIDKIEKLNQNLKEREAKLKAIEAKLKDFEEEVDTESLSEELADDFMKIAESNELLIKGDEFYEQRKYEEAIKCFDKAIEIKPDYQDAWIDKGNSLDELGKHEEAIKCFDKAIEIKPDKDEAWYNKGIALYKLGKHEEAIKCFDKSIKLKPDDYVAMISKSTVLLKIGEYYEAMKCINKAIVIKPYYSLVWYNKACAYSLMKNKEKMLESLKRVIELDEGSKEEAKTDEAFKEYWDDEDFKKLVE